VYNGVLRVTLRVTDQVNVPLRIIIALDVLANPLVGVVQDSGDDIGVGVVPVFVIAVGVPLAIVESIRVTNLDSSKYAGYQVIG
jgi:hypothetical protein